jgi:hypothetical protein
MSLFQQRAHILPRETLFDFAYQQLVPTKDFPQKKSSFLSKEDLFISTFILRFLRSLFAKRRTLVF